MIKKRLLSFILLLTLAGCSSLPEINLPFLKQVNALTCTSLPVGILIGDEGNPIADEQRIGYEMALAEINGAGGVNGCEMELVYSVEAPEGAQNQAHLEVRALVEDHKVVALVGSTSNTASMYAAALANYFEVPMLVPSASGAHILPEENFWAFRLNATETAYADLIFDMVKTELGQSVTVAVLFEDSTFGHDAAIAAVSSIDKYELDVVGYIPFNPSQTSYAALVEEIDTVQPNVLLLAFSDPTLAKTLLTTFGEEGLARPSFTIARAGGFLSDAFLLDSEGVMSPLTEGMVFATQWTGCPGDDVEVDKSFIADFKTYIRNKEGTEREPTLYNAEAYRSLIILSRTLTYGMSSDPEFMKSIENQRQALRQQLFGFNTKDLVCGGVDFGAGGQNESPLFLIQVLDGEIFVVYPADVAQRAPLITITSFNTLD